MEKISLEDWESAIRKAISWEDKYARLDGIDKEEEVPEPVETEVLEVQELPPDELQEPQFKCTGILFFLFNSFQPYIYLFVLQRLIASLQQKRQKFRQTIFFTKRVTK